MTGPAAARRPRLTGRAAVLAVVLCAVMLSLAYPVREYVSQRRQLDQLLAARQQLALQLRRLQARQRLVTSPAYIAAQARDRLHMCPPAETCYVVIDPPPPGAAAAARRAATPWYERLWTSVRRADRQPGAEKRRAP
jgi:cell division protein FtsB